jgi:hypothetical protein
MKVPAYHPDYGAVTITEVINGVDIPPGPPDLLGVGRVFRRLAIGDRLARFTLADGTTADHWLSKWPEGAAAINESED